MSKTVGAGTPDPPQGELRLLSADLTRSGLEKLLGVIAHAHTLVASEVSLQAMLQHIVTAARELVGARYAALGVIGQDGLLDEFVHDGMAEDAVERIGERPRGRGILGLLTSHPAPVRLSDLAAHPAAAGFPLHHPAMDSVLGVPIRVRDRVLGNLYLTGSTNGQFSAEDEQSAVALAASAGVAVDSARRDQESEQRHRWATASIEVTRQLLAGQDEHPLDIILQGAQQTASADVASLALVAGPGSLQIQAIRTGVTSQTLMDLDTGAVGEVARSGTPVLVTASRDAGDGDPAARIGSVIIVPLTDGDKIMGTLSVGRLPGRRSFTGADLNHLAGFASHSGVAMELDRVRSDQQAKHISDDHDRIATALNNHVIHELFAVSLGLQGLVATGKHPVFRARVNGYIAILDATISHIPTAVYDIDTTPGQHTPSLRHRILAAIEDHMPALGFPVTTTFQGQLGRAMPSALADDVVAAVQEALTTIAGHANTTRAELRVSIDRDSITVENTDNGTSAQPPAPADRPTASGPHTHRRTGNLTTTTTSNGDTRLTWTRPHHHRSTPMRPP